MVRDTGIRKPAQHSASLCQILAWRGLVITLMGVVAILMPMAAMAASSLSIPPSGERSDPASSQLWNTEICIIDADGSNERNLTQNPADDSAPAWSPDGKKIAFLSNRDGGQAIYVMNSDGSNPARLSEKSAGAPVWSPDGRKVAFARFTNEIWIADADRGDTFQLISGKSIVMSGQPWSPDSKRLAFSGMPFAIKPQGTYLPKKYWDESLATENIYVINTDGSGFTQISDVSIDPVKHRASNPSWSPDGRSIAFLDTGYLYLATVIPTGKKPVLLSRANTGSYPTWSDGNKVTFISGHGPYSDGKIHVIDVQRGNETTFGSEVVSKLGNKESAWSPDRKRLAFMRDSKIHVIDIASGRETTLTEGGYPAWSPDGKKIAFIKAVMADATSSLAGSWTSLAVAPSIMWNSVLAWDGGDNIYAYSGTMNQYGPYRSDTDQKFYCFAISGNSWSPITAIPDSNAQPSGFIWLAGEGLYTFDKGKNVWCYQPSSSSWKRITSFPGKNYVGSVGITRADKKYIYTHDGTSFWRYSVSSNSWETVAEGLWCPPNPSAMVWTGGDFIYGFSASRQESGERAFWRYSISSNQWSALPMPPGQVAVAEKVHLAWGGSDYIYLYGEASRTTPHLWRYSMLGDTWEALEPLPEDQVTAMVATSSGIYVAPGGMYSELLGCAPSLFYFSPSPAPISVPGVPQELRKISVYLYGQKTQVAIDEDVILELSAINLITNPTMTVQLILQVPPGMSVTSTAFVEAGAGQYTATYAVEPGYARQIEVHIRPNQSGSFNIVGYLAYYLGEDKSTAEYRTVNMPVKVASDKASAERTTPQPSRKGIGFLSCSTPVEGATPSSTHELVAGWFPIGLTWGCLGICYGIRKRRRRE